MEIGATSTLFNACDNKAIDVVQKFSSLGFDYIELVSRTPKLVDTRKMIKALKQHNITVNSVCAWCDYRVQNPAHENPYVRKAYIDYLKDLVDLASNLKAKHIVTSAGVISGMSRAEAYQYCAECLREIGDYALPSDVRIAVEAINRFITNFINKTDQALELVKRVNQPIVGITLDTFHMNIEERSNEESIRKADKSLFHLHFADNNRLAPGLGNIDFKKIINALKTIDYAGNICLEIQALTDPMKEAEIGLNFVRRLTSSEEI